MTTIAEARSDVLARPWFGPALTGVVRTVALGIGCLTPLTAIFVLGWMTRKTARDVAGRLHELLPSSPPPLPVALKSRVLLVRLSSQFTQVLLAGAKALAAALSLTLPFSLIAQVGWLAGWENSFNKGYEFAGLWPFVSIAGVVLSLPVLALLPMALAHHAVTGRFRAIFEVREIVALMGAAGWRYLALMTLLTICGSGVLVARILPTFAERLSTAAASGTPEGLAHFAFSYRLLTTALFLAALLSFRAALAWTYAHAAARRQIGYRPGFPIKALVFLGCAPLVLWLAFTVYVAQFLNYATWNWMNQPMLMLPWLG